jgi:hypothetical protein
VLIEERLRHLAERQKSENPGIREQNIDAAGLPADVPGEAGDLFEAARVRDQRESLWAQFLLRGRDGVRVAAK